MDLKKLMTQSFLTRTISGIVLVVLLMITGLLGGPVLYFYNQLSFSLPALDSRL